MGQLIVKTIGSGPTHDYPDLATWWNAQRGNIAASGIISIAELENEEFLTTSVALDMQASQAVTSPFSYYIIRTKPQYRWKGFFDGTEVGSDVARLRTQNNYCIKCEVPYTRFEGFAIKNTASSDKTTPELAGMKLTGNNISVDGVLIYNSVFSPNLEGNTVTTDIASAYGIYALASGINIINTTVAQVVCTNDGGGSDTGDKNTLAVSYGIFGWANVLNCTVTDIRSAVNSQAGANPNEARSYGMYIPSGTVRNNIVWGLLATSPDGPESTACYHFGSSTTHSNNIADDTTTASDTNGLINYTPSTHFNSITSNYDLTAKSNTPLAGSGLAQSYYFWDFRGQPRIGNWTSGHDQIGSGIMTDISYVPLVCFNRIPETFTNVWFGDNFDRVNLGNNWLGNSWLLDNGRLKQNLTVGQYVIVSGQYPYNQDIVFDAIASGTPFASTQEQGMYLRYVNSDNYIRLSWQPKLDFIDVRGFVDGSQVFFDSVTLSSDLFEDGQRYNIQIAAIENNINVFIDGVNNATFTLDSTLNTLKTNSTVGFVSLNTELDSNRTFYIDDFSLNGPMMPLYIRGSGDTITNNIPLYLNAVSGINNTLPLYLFSAETPVSGFLDLYLFGVSGIIDNNISLFTLSYGNETNSLPLTLLAPMESTNNIPLFLQGYKSATSTNDRLPLLTDDFSSGLGSWTTYGSGTWIINANEQLLVNNTNYSNSFITNNTDPILNNYKVSTNISGSGTTTNYNGRRAGIVSHFTDNNNYYNLWLSYQNVGQDSTLVVFNAKKAGSIITPFTLRIYEDLIAQNNKWGFTAFGDGTINIYKNDNIFHSFILNSNYILPSVGFAGLGNLAQSSPYLLYDNFEIEPAEFDLFVHGHIVSSGSLPLYLEVTATPTNNIPLYIGSQETQISFIPLFLGAGTFTQASGGINLNTFGATTSGIFNTIPITMMGMPSSGVYNNSCTLFISGPDTGNLTGNIPLTINGGTFNLNNQLPLVLHNHGVASGLNLFIEGLSLSGADDSAGIPMTAAIPLFIARNENEIVPLYISGRDSNASGNMTLTISGASGVPTNNLPLYMFGTFTSNSGIPLYTHGF